MTEQLFTVSLFATRYIRFLAVDSEHSNKEIEMTIEAIDELDRAKALIELVKMACRGDDEESNSIASGLCYAVECLDRAVEKLSPNT